MQRTHRVVLAAQVFLVGAVAVGGGPLPAQVQQQVTPPKTLTLTTASVEARDATYMAGVNFFNIHFSRSAELAKQAMTADPNLGMARAIYAWANPPELTPPQRAAELDRAVADGARASVGELLATAAIRAVALNRPEANVLLDALIALLPEDPVPPYLRGLRAGDPAQVVMHMEGVTKKFPDFPPAWNILAYQRWATGNRDGALAAVATYARLLPDHPNSHDSYGEILQFAGRLPEALQHYERVVQLDPTFGGGQTGIAEVHMLMGHPAVARDAYAKWAAAVPTAGGKLAARASGALMYVLEGKPNDAVRTLNAIATEAEAQNLKPQAAGAHRTMALIEAAFGNKSTVSGHLAKAAELAGADIPVQHRFTALAQALAGQLDEARAAAAKYDQALASAPAVPRRTVREVNAVIAAAEKDFVRAKSELAEAGAAATFGRAVVAEALAKSGSKADAQALKAEILGTGTATLFDVLARAKVQKL